MDPFVDLFEELLHLLDGETRLSGTSVHALTVFLGPVPPGVAELHLDGRAEALKVDAGLRYQVHLPGHVDGRAGHDAKGTV